jgi:hypothetical protein
VTDVLHVGVVRRDDCAQLIVPRSIVVPCDDCGVELWVDPACCAEIGAAHAHVCYWCAGPVAIEQVRIPNAALRTLDSYLRRN